MAKLKLLDGNEIPLIGVGTHKLPKDRLKQIVQQAIRMGYKHIDTATGYNNHQEIGEAIRDFKRQDLFLTTKINSQDLMTGSLDRVVGKILEDLQTEYIDLLLIHGPKVPIIETIKAMQNLQKSGDVQSIGVSNFTIQHLERIQNADLKIAVNQIELHPYLTQDELVCYCNKHAIALTAYRSFCQNEVLQNELIINLSKKYEKTPGQIALRWAIDRGFSIIPRASSPKHQLENLEIFDFRLNELDILAINSLDRNFRTCTGSWAEF